MADRFGERIDEDLDAALALLAAPGAIVVPRAGGTAMPRRISGPELVELVELSDLGLASVERVGDWVTFGAMVRLRELAEVLPAPLVELVHAEVPPDLLDQATVGGTVMAGGPVSPLLTGLLACEAVVTLMSRRVRHDLPLAALLVGATPPQDTLVLSVRLCVAGQFGVARADGERPGPFAVARRTGSGRLLVAMGGVAPGPVLVRDPIDVRRTSTPTLEFDVVERVHRDAIAAIGGSGAVVVSGSVASPVVPARLDRPRPPRPPFAEITTTVATAMLGEALPTAEVVVVRPPEVPPLRVVGQPHSLTSPGAARFASGDPLHLAPIAPSAGEGFDRRLATSMPGVVSVIQPEPDGTADGWLGVLASSAEAAEDAAARLAGPVEPASDLLSRVDTVTLVGNGNGNGVDVGEGLDETMLRIDEVWCGDPPSDSVSGELDEEGRLVMRTGVVDPFELRRSLAERLDVGAARLRVVARPVRSGRCSGTVEELVARAVLETGCPVVARAPHQPGAALAVTVHSASSGDGDVVFLEANTFGPNNASVGARADAVAWAAELHLATLARRADRPRDELTIDGSPMTPQLRDALALAARLIRYDRRHDLRWASPPERPDVRRGIGFAMAPALAATPAAVSATVSSAGGSSFLVAVTAGDTPDGLHLALGQVAAEVLGVGAAQITVLGGDTDRVPPGDLGEGAGFDVNAGAVKQAADELRRRLQRRAAHRLGVPARAVELSDGSAIAPDGRSLPFDELTARRSTNGDGAEPLVGTGFGHSGIVANGAGAVFAAVEVELSTGAVTVHELITTTVAGVIVNPLGAAAHQRVECVDSCAAALGRPLVGDDVLHTAVFVQDVHDDAPFGARSLGGVPRRAALPALHAAIHDATGVELGVVPFSSARLRAALQAER